MLLHRKLIVASLLLFGLLYGAVVSLELGYSRQHLQHDLNSHLKLTADQFQRLLSPYLQRGDIAGAVDLLKRWPLARTGETIRLQLPGDTRGVERVAEVASQTAPEWFKQWMAPPQASVQRELPLPDGRGALLTVQGSAAEGYQLLWSQAFSLTIWFGLSLLLALLLVIYGLRHWMAPLRELQAHTDKLANPRLGQVLPEPSLLELRGLVASFNAMSERLRRLFGRQAEELEELRRAAYQDPTSGIGNRSFFMGELQEWMSEAGEGGLVILHLNHLKRIHSDLGYARHDRLITETSEQLRSLRRSHPAVVIARLSDAEFAVLLPGHDPEQLQSVVDELEQRMFAVVASLGAKWGALFAIGGAMRLPGDNSTDVMARTDMALQQVRQTNLETAKLLSDVSDSAALGCAKWRSLVQKAMAGGGLVYQLQPMMTMTGKISGMELLSCLEAGGTRYPAAQFMPTVEHCELGAQFDRTVLEQIAPHLANQRVPLYVNLSVHSLGDVGFVSWLAGWLESNPQRSRWLGFELPEAALAINPQGLEAVARLLGRHGVRFGIDRVGRHLEQLRTLVELGPNFIKVDRSLVLCAMEDDNGFFKSLARMAHDLDIDLIALRVETEGELTELASRSVDGYQGYMRKPIPWKIGPSATTRKAD